MLRVSRLKWQIIDFIDLIDQTELHSGGQEHFPARRRSHTRYAEADRGGRLADRLTIVTTRKGS